MRGSDMLLGPVKQALSGKFPQELRSVRTLKEMCLHGVNFMREAGAFGWCRGWTAVESIATLLGLFT